MTATEAATAVAAIETVPVADLPEPKRVRNAQDQAYADALYAVIADGVSAAAESTIHADTASATKRAAALKRLVAGNAPAGKSIGSRLIAVDGGHKVAVFLTDAKPRKAKTDKPAK